MQNVIRPGSIIHSAQRRAYHGIKQQLGLQHRTVNHSLYVVDPGTGVHTQHIESYWNKCKGRLKAMHGTTIGKLPSYLDRFMWRDIFDRTRTKTASTTFKDTSPNSIQCSDQSTFSITGPFQGHQYYSKRLQFKPKCHGIDSIMYNSLIPFANFGSSQYSILKLIAMHNLACSYVIYAVHNIRGKSPVMSKYVVWSVIFLYILVNSGY